MPAGPYLSCGRGASVEGENPIIEVLPKGFVLGLRMEMMFVQIFFWGGIRYSAIFLGGGDGGEDAFCHLGYGGDCFRMNSLYLVYIYICIVSESFVKKKTFVEQSVSSTQNMNSICSGELDMCVIVDVWMKCGCVFKQDYCILFS